MCESYPMCRSTVKVEQYLHAITFKYISVFITVFIITLIFMYVNTVFRYDVFKYLTMRKVNTLTA